MRCPHCAALIGESAWVIDRHLALHHPDALKPRRPPPREAYGAVTGRERGRDRHTPHGVKGHRAPWKRPPPGAEEDPR